MARLARRGMCRGGRGALIAWTASAGIALAAPASAQTPTAVRVRADNDAFSFWLPPWERTDRDYTSGVAGTVELPGRARWMPRSLAPDLPSAVHAFGIGQAIYTSDVEVVNGVARARPDSRPNGAWLYATAVARDSGTWRVQEWRVSAGVVGPQALGEPMQDFFHSFGREYQRPDDWTTQLPFEPGFVASYTRVVPLWLRGDLSALHAGLSTTVSGSVGTILTAATGGFKAFVTLPEGLNTSQALVPRLVLAADWTGHVVARDEFLDGTLFRRSARVDRSPFYDEQSLSLELRWRAVTAIYRAVSTGRQYKTQLDPSRWGSMTLEWRPRR